MAGHGESIIIKTPSNFQNRLFFTLSYTELLSNSSLRSCLNCKSIICSLRFICNRAHSGGTLFQRIYTSFSLSRMIFILCLKPIGR